MCYIISMLTQAYLSVRLRANNNMNTYFRDEYCL